MSADILRVSATLLGWRNSDGLLATYIRIVDDPAEAISAHEAMMRMETGKRRGFGSVKVRARIGGSEWSTSVFPQDYGWFLPVKAAVRRAEGLAEGDTLTAELELL